MHTATVNDSGQTTNTNLDKPHLSMNFIQVISV